MTKPGAVRPIVIPLAKKQLSRDVLHSNLRTAKISRDRYLALLKKIEPHLDERTLATGKPDPLMGVEFSRATRNLTAFELADA